MDALLVGDDPVLACLRDQCAVSSVESRDLTEVGFFTYFRVDESAPRVEPVSFEIRDVIFEVAGVRGGAMAVLYVRGGAIGFLEVVTLADDWPDNARILSIRYRSRKPDTEDEYVTCGQRDMTLARGYWAS